MLINLIIIYFACGSPIGVYRTTRLSHLRSPGQAAAIGVYFILWPVFAPAILRRALLFGETNIEHAIKRICSEIESIAFDGRPTEAVFEFREVFARYAYLTLALVDGGATRFPAELFAEAGNRDLPIASRCFERRNRRRLAFHQMRARKEFVEMISVIRPGGDKIVDLCLTLARLLNDTQTAEQLLGQQKMTMTRSANL